MPPSAPSPNINIQKKNPHKSVYNLEQQQQKRNRHGDESRMSKPVLKQLASELLSVFIFSILSWNHSCYKIPETELHWFYRTALFHHTPVTKLWLNGCEE